MYVYLDQANAHKNTTLTSGVTTVTSAFAKNSHSTYLRPLNVTFIYLPSGSLVSVRKNPRGKFQLSFTAKRSSRMLLSFDALSVSVNCVDGL